jgi:hypothetical protein
MLLIMTEEVPLKIKGDVTANYYIVLLTQAFDDYFKEGFFFTKHL